MEAKIIYPVRVVFRKKNNKYLIKGKTNLNKIKIEVRNIFDGFHTIKKYLEDGIITKENFINLFLEIKDLKVPILPKYLYNQDSEIEFLNQSFEYFEDRLIELQFNLFEDIPTFVKNEAGNFYNLYYELPSGEYDISDNIYCRKHAEILYQFMKEKNYCDEIDLLRLEEEIKNLELPYYIFSIDLN